MQGLAITFIALLGISQSVVLRSARDNDVAGSLVQATVRRAEPAPRIFEKDFTRPISIPDEGIDAAVDICRSGRLFRYSSKSAEVSQVALAETEFAAMTKARYALGVNSCSSAILIALRAVGLKPGDKVLTNAFTFTAVTSTLLRLGADPILVECCDRCGWWCYEWATYRDLTARVESNMIFGHGTLDKSILQP